MKNLHGTGISNAEAARRLGFDGYPTIWKKYKELERIQAEKNIKQNSSNFRDNFKIIVESYSKEENIEFAKMEVSKKEQKDIDER